MNKRLLALMLAFIVFLSTAFGAFAENVQADGSADAERAQAVIDLIDAIGKVTPETVEDVLAAAWAYENLTDAQKRRVSNHDDLMEDISAYAALLAAGKVCAEAVTASLDAPRLSVLAFRKGNAPDAEAFALQPAFDPEVRSYTLVVPDSVNPVSDIALWATLSEGAEGEITVEYTSLINDREMKKTVTSGAELGATLMGCVKVKDLKENTLTIRIGGEEAYTVRLVKQPTLSDLQVTADGESVELDASPAPDRSEYSAAVDADSKIGVSVQTTSEGVDVKINGQTETEVQPVWSERESEIRITLSAEGAVDGSYALKLYQKPEKLVIQSQPTKTSYQVGETFDIAGLELQAVYADGEVRDVPAESVAFEPAQPLTSDVTAITLKYAGVQIELPIRVGGGLRGSGTQEDPWQIATGADFETVRALVEQGMRFEGEYLKMTGDIVLPDGWMPIGSSMETAFSGNLNGGGFMLTVPEGGLPLLGCVENAKVSNLNIFGKRIAGYGLVNDLQGVGYSGTAITIDHVTLKSGSSTLKSGLIGTKIHAQSNAYAGCSKDYLVHISNCVVESGVVIGYNKDQRMIGSIAGRINGTITHCESAATVYGTDYVGGILGSRDNALGTCKVTGCSFTGSVTASGEQAGGIVGGGYSDSSAPNGIRISIDDCSASGSVTGRDKVGGILGGDIMVAQVWDAYTFTNNSFTGKVSGSGSAIGGIIGYYRSLNRLDDIAGNYYASSCGAKSGFGFVMYVDTSCTSHETASGALYFNTETNTSACPEVTGCAWKTAHNRSDDPLGADAVKLMRTDGMQIIEVTDLSLDQSELNLKTGDTAKLTAIVTPENATDKTVRWSSADESVAVVTNGTVTAKGFGSTVITATAGKCTAECRVSVTAEPAHSITVYMTVSDRGVLAQTKDGSAMFNQSVQVSDLNSDGVLTCDEALAAAHAAYCPNGYASEPSGWGVSVTRLWGVESMNFSFYLNDSALESHVGDTSSSVLHAGDSIVASVNQDDVYYADHYTAFAKRSSTATVGQTFTLSLNGGSGGELTVGEWKNGSFVAIDGASVDANGNVSVVFEKAGTYLLTAKGTVRKTVQDWSAGGKEVEADCPIIAPGCLVKVQKADSVPSTATAEKLTIGGSYKKTYAVGDRMDLAGMTLTVHYSNGAKREIDVNDASIAGFDTATRGEKTVTLTYRGVSASFVITVTKAAGTIDVTLSVLGDSKHGSGKTHTLAGGGLTTWIKASTWNVKSGSTVWDVLKQCLDENGMSYKNASGNYISAVNGLAEFDNGKNSGWMYTLNGKYSLLGVSEQKLKDGDRIVFHYTDDYTLEKTGFAPPSTGDDGESGDSEEEDLMVDAVEKLIANIGSVTFDASCKAKIDAARKAYSKLRAAQKKKVENYSELQKAEKEYAALEKKQDQAQADAVIQLIDAMGSDGAKISAARKAYNALTDAQRALVTNYAMLTAAEYAQADAIATDSDRAASANAIDLIDAIGTRITAESEEQILKARSAYDALTDTQRALVTNAAQLTAAELACAHVTELADFEALYLATGEKLEATEEIQVGSIGGEWLALGLARSGRSVADGYRENALAYIAQNIDENFRLHPAKATDNARLILALTALGMDACDVDGYDLVAGLNEMDYVENQGLNGPIWTLIALDSGEYEITDGDVTRETLIACILDVQLEDGGWTLSGETADADMTAMALQALAPYYDEQEDSELNAAIEGGLDCLSVLQMEDGGFGTLDSDGEMIETSESIAQVIVALTALEIDPDADERFVKDGASVLDALVAFGLSEGGFIHIAEAGYDQMATEQGYYAMTAYVRYLAKRNRLYDMTDALAQSEEAGLLTVYIDISDEYGG